MLHNIKILLIIGISILLQNCCDEKNNNCNSDSAICEYDAICLDYRSFEATPKEDLLGEWILEAFVNPADCSVEYNFEKGWPRGITMTFFENDSIEGHTANMMLGIYSINAVNNGITISLHALTEVYEGYWGSKFWESINYTDYFTIVDNYLILHTSRDVLIFTKN